MKKLFQIRSDSKSKNQLLILFRYVSYFIIKQFWIIRRQLTLLPCITEVTEEDTLLSSESNKSEFASNFNTAWSRLPTEMDRKSEFRTAFEPFPDLKKQWLTDDTTASTLQHSNKAQDTFDSKSLVYSSKRDKKRRLLSAIKEQDELYARRNSI